MSPGRKALGLLQNKKGRLTKVLAGFKTNLVEALPGKEVWVGVLIGEGLGMGGDAGEAESLFCKRRLGKEVAPTGKKRILRLLPMKSVYQGETLRDYWLRGGAGSSGKGRFFN